MFRESFVCSGHSDLGSSSGIKMKKPLDAGSNFILPFPSFSTVYHFASFRKRKQHRILIPFELPLLKTFSPVSYVRPPLGLGASGTPVIGASQKGYQMNIKSTARAHWTPARDTHMKTGGEVNTVSPNVTVGATAIREKRYMRKSRFI